jgi:hypothetical protein
MGMGCLKAKVRVPAAASLLAGVSGAPSCSADMTAVRGAGAVTVAVYVVLTAGVSWHGTSDRAWMAWHWVYRYGCACGRG